MFPPPADSAKNTGFHGVKLNWMAHYRENEYENQRTDRSIDRPEDVIPKTEVIIKGIQHRFDMTRHKRCICLI